jgi:hypothetical protein
MPQSRYVRCRYCGSLLRGWLPVANAPDGALLLHHLADMPPDHVGQYLTRMPTDDAHDRGVMEAFERVEDQQANRATTDSVG